MVENVEVRSDDSGENYRKLLFSAICERYLSISPKNKAISKC